VDGQDERDVPPARRLRQTLRNEWVNSQLTMVQVEARSGLKHTTVSQALSLRARTLPSERTVSTLAKLFGLNVDALLALRRAAHVAEGQERPIRSGRGVAQEPPDRDVEAAILGTPIGLCDPLDLEVHPAGDGGRDTGRRRLPGYVRRAHDETLAAVVDQVLGGHSAMRVLVGSSSTGKTRACWEAVQPLAAAGWRLWHPYDPTRADAALAGIKAVGPRTVVWLNEAQHYLDAGEHLAAALHTLLTDPTRSPVLILGTLWPEYADRYTARPGLGEPDPYARVRELLADRRIHVPDTFNAKALARARELAEGGDRILADVLGRGHDNVAQQLAGAPELLSRYHEASPVARGLLWAAMDARRLGVSLHLPRGFLAAAVLDYLDNDAYDSLSGDWLKRSLADLANPVHGNLAPLRRVRPRPSQRPPRSAPAPAWPLIEPYRLADYLEQHGRHERQMLCPPASFWHAALIHLTNPKDLYNLAEAAHDRGRLQWADNLHRLYSLYSYAARTESPDMQILVAQFWAKAENPEGAEDPYQSAAVTDALTQLGRWGSRDWGPKGRGDFYRPAAGSKKAGDLVRLAMSREWAGDHEGAETLANRAAGEGNSSVLFRLAMSRGEAQGRVDELLRFLI
jgi:hypothetical protein